MIEVTLDWFEVEMAAGVGVRRRVEAAWRQGRRDLYAVPGEAEPSSNWQTHLEGAIGELAFAKAMGRYWNGSVNTFRQNGDVGDVQIRARSLHHYDLIVRTHDRDGDYFVLLTGITPSFRVQGYILGANAKRPEWLKDHGGHGNAYFVPQSALTPLTPKAVAA